MDDAISLEKINDEVFRVGIHISDVASIIKKGSEIDKEAFSRVESTYVLKLLKKCHKPMIPHELNQDVVSLVKDQPRLCISLWLYMNREGLIDFKNAKYEMSVI
jgi:exoribonuclease R